MTREAAEVLVADMSPAELAELIALLDRLAQKKPSTSMEGTTT